MIMTRTFHLSFLVPLGTVVPDQYLGALIEQKEENGKLKLVFDLPSERDRDVHAEVADGPLILTTKSLSEFQQVIREAQEILRFLGTEEPMIEPISRAQRAIRLGIHPLLDETL